MSELLVEPRNDEERALHEVIDQNGAVVDKFKLPFTKPQYRQIVKAKTELDNIPEGERGSMDVPWDYGLKNRQEALGRIAETVAGGEPTTKRVEPAARQVRAALAPLVPTPRA